MRRALAALAILAGCGSPSSGLAPLVPDDRPFLQERVREALDAPYVVANFYAEYESAGQVKASCKGTSRGFRSGVVLVEEESGPGGRRRILRVGGRAWIYNEGWRDASGAGLKNAGAGFQDPYEVLAVLDSAAQRFVAAPGGGMECAGVKGFKILGPLLDRADAQPPAEAAIDGLLKSGFRGGALVTRFSITRGSEFWMAKADVVSWGPAPPMTFDDIPAPFTPEMKAAVRKATEGK